MVLGLLIGVVPCTGVAAQDSVSHSTETRDPRGSLSAEILGGGAASVVSFGLGYGLGCGFARFAASLGGGAPKSCLSASYVAGGAVVGLAISIGLVPVAVAAFGKAPSSSGDYRLGALAAFLTVFFTAPLMGLAIAHDERWGVPAFLLENAVVVTATIVVYRWSCVRNEPIIALVPSKGGLSASLALRM